MSNTQSQKLMVEWHSINWRKLEKRVYKLQKRIYQASQRGELGQKADTPRKLGNGCQKDIGTQ